MTLGFHKFSNPLLEQELFALCVKQIHMHHSLLVLSLHTPLPFKMFSSLIKQAY